jgi:DNA-binding MarR family transcriptional regulator
MGRTQLIQEIVDLQRKVDQARRRRGLDSWLDLPLTMAQLKSLFFISNQAGTTSGKLAAALGVTPTNVTGIIDRLVRRGLVTRAENAEDRRMLLLTLTPRGDELVVRLRELRRSYLMQLLARLDDEDLASLARGLGALTRAAEAQEGEYHV